MGYIGYSMSENAALAYYESKKPKSKWSKKDIIERLKEVISEDDLKPILSVDSLKTLPLCVLRREFLQKTEWHHTSKCFNRTGFYDVNADAFEKLTEEDLEDLVLDYEDEKEERKNAKAEEPEYWEAKWSEWSGSRKYGRFENYAGTGYVRGNYFYYKCGDKERKKRVDGTHFELIREVDPPESL